VVVANLFLCGAEVAALKHPIGFKIISCCWPLPVECDGGTWLSAPAWNAPEMPDLPRLRYEEMEGQVGVVIDWCEEFRGGFLTFITGGEMRGFHVVFRIRFERAGLFVFWDDDGCIVRRDGVVIHEDRKGHPLQRHSIEVRKGDILEFAQWQDIQQWLWKGCLIPAEPAALGNALLPYLPCVLERLRTPAGPPLKMMTNGHNPVRAALSVYSMVLNGYSPEQVLLYGENQWTPESRQCLKQLMPFAAVVPTPEALKEIGRAAGKRLRHDAATYWWVFKACLAVFCAPRTSCMMDDDVIILDTTSDALSTFQTHDLVYARDRDYAREYTAAWNYSQRFRGPLSTGEFNAGLYWIRSPEDAADMVRMARRTRAKDNMFLIWEQGFIAVGFASRKTFGLPPQRYLYARFDGLPGDVLGYDYARNPCGFASIHFGGVYNKLGDAISALIAKDVLTPKHR